MALNKQQINWEVVKEATGNGQLLSGYGFVLNIAPPSLSREKEDKDETNNNNIRTRN